MKDEPKKIAFGGVVVDAESRVLLRKVTGNYKGYVWTFPKGRPDTGETGRQAALREVREETGYECEVVGRLQFVAEGLETLSQFFLMRPVHDHGDFHEETSEVRWATYREAKRLLSMTEHKTGRMRDLAVLTAFNEHLR